MQRWVYWRHSCQNLNGIEVKSWKTVDAFTIQLLSILIAKPMVLLMTAFYILSVILDNADSTQNYIS